jgi:4-amino-4-deoxy-L-arabinose transferase-like glycosyltransferase
MSAIPSSTSHRARGSLLDLHGALPLLLLALWLVLLAGWRPLSLPDEGRYGGVAYEMVASGDWLTPTLFGLPYFHKPPLMYWVDAAAMQLLGPTPLALRAAPLLGAWLMGLAVWLEARRRGGTALAVQALTMMAVLPMFYLGAQYANHDMLVAGWISLAIVAARQAQEQADRRRLAWVCAAWAAAALAVLSKGLIGVVLPALVLAPGLLLQRRWSALRLLLHPLGLAVFAVVALPWFVQMQRVYPGFFDYFIMEQHFRRYTQARFNNAQPWWFFIVVLPLATVPLSLALPRVLRVAWKERRFGADLWWVFAVLLFFSLPRSKLVGYILPALVPTAFLLLEAWRGLRFAPRVMALSAVLCVAIVPSLMRWGHPDHSDLGQALQQRVAPGDRVVLLGEAFFDLRLQARLPAPPAVLAPWAELRRQGGDSWQRELMDAARFAPDGGTAVLWTPERLAAARCEPGRLWLLVETREPPAEARLVYRARRGALYELPHSCP